MSAEVKTCGDCKHWEQWNQSPTRWGTCIALKGIKLPMWCSAHKCVDKTRNTPAEDCDCFERKDSK